MLIPGTTLIKNGSSFPPPRLLRAPCKLKMVHLSHHHAYSGQHVYSGGKSMYDKHQPCATAENQKYMYRKKNSEIQNKEIAIYSPNHKLNKNRFYLQTKISIKIKIRDKKRFTKNFMVAIFRETIFLGSNFTGGNLQGGGG